MKTKEVSVLCCLFLIGSLSFVARDAMAAEKAKYQVLEKEDGFELRAYEPQIVAETIVEGDFSEVGNIGFKRLFDFISGQNIGNHSIEMTAPVTQEAESEKIAMTAPVTQEKKDGQWVIAFLMPSKYTLKTVPMPVDPRIKIKQIPAKLMAARTYSGTWSKKGYEENKTKLERDIERRKLRVVGEPIWARYNPPFMPWFLRRNEVLIPVERTSE